VKRLRILTFCTVIASILIFFYKKRYPTTIAIGDRLVIKKEWLAINKKPLTPRKDIRPADQTFLTFPEWYLVFSPEEQANYFKHTTVTSFPFNSHTRQIWESYRIVNNQIKGNFPPNGGYHFMIWVIGSSASVEYSVKAVYEKLIGRITDTHEVITDEDKFNAKFTQAYVEFIKDRPWYEFDFKTQLKDLWRDNAYWGDHFGRKIERRYILTSELLVKYVYGKLIALGTKKVYDEALPNTVVVINNDSLISLPRYDKFNPAVQELALKGNQIKEIAGNNSAILLTVIVPENSKTEFDGAQEVFIQPLASDLSKKRIAIAIPVTSLHSLLVDLNRRKIEIEHVFDY
jgi:hypothetical protein